MATGGERGGSAPHNAQAKGEALSEAMVIVPRGHTPEEETLQSNKKLTAKKICTAGTIYRELLSEPVWYVRGLSARGVIRRSEPARSRIPSTESRTTCNLKNLNRTTRLDDLQSGTAKKTKSEKQKALALSRKKTFFGARQRRQL